MEHNRYTLRIVTVIHADDYDDTVEAEYPCAYSCQDGTHRLKYDDADNGFTVFKFTPEGEIQIRRRQSSPIVMREGYSHQVDYETPYGSIPMCFALQSAVSSLSEAGGRVEYTAKIHINGEPQINRVTMELVPIERMNSDI